MIIKSVILSGGSGTRLWPASRESYPKQLLPLTGERSLLQETALRLKDFPGGEVDPRPLVVTNEEYRFIIAEQLRQIGVRSPQIVLEPVGRNTAPALTLAALVAADEGDPILLVMPADHVITEQPAFQHAIAVGAKAAATGALVGDPAATVDRERPFDAPELQAAVVAAMRVLIASASVRTAAASPARAAASPRI